MKNSRIKNFVMRGFLTVILATGIGITINKSQNNDVKTISYEVAGGMDDYECPTNNLKFVNNRTGEVRCEELPVIGWEEIASYYGRSGDFYALKEMDCKSGEHLIIDRDTSKCVEDPKEYYIGNPVIIYQCPKEHTLEEKRCINVHTGEISESIIKAFCPDGYNVSYSGEEGFKCISPKSR